jgi:hypothetical protein
VGIEGYLLGLARTQAATRVPGGFQFTYSVSPRSDRKLTSQLVSMTRRDSSVSLEHALERGAGS